MAKSEKHKGARSYHLRHHRNETGEEHLRFVKENIRCVLGRPTYLYLLSRGPGKVPDGKFAFLLRVH